MGADSSRSGESMTWEQFRALFVLILRNQSTYFREIYNEKKIAELDLQKHLKENEENLKLCFRVYDKDNSGYLDFSELTQLLREMSLHRQFALHYNPEQAFNYFCRKIWYGFDANGDGKISYEEFIQIFNTILDR